MFSDITYDKLATETTVGPRPLRVITVKEYVKLFGFLD